MDARIFVVRVVAALALGGDQALGVEELGELGVGHLVTVDPEVLHEDAVQRRLLRRATVAPHPDGSRRDQHETVGVGIGRQAERERRPGQNHESDQPGQARHGEA